MQMRAALYLRVSTTDRQTNENQRMVLAKVAEHRGWMVVQVYEDIGISGATGRDKRPAFDQMLKDAVRRKFDLTMCWSIDRLGRSGLHVAMTELRVSMPITSRHSTTIGHLRSESTAGARLTHERSDDRMQNGRLEEPTILDGSNYDKEAEYAKLPRFIRRQGKLTSNGGCD
jgi:hypothetical protein